MKNKYIGVTLMFYKKEKSKYEAVQSSYVLKLSNYKNFKTDIHTLVEKLINKEYLNYTFLGVTDLYISEKPGNGKYMGRTSYYDLKKIKEAEALILNKNKINRIIARSDNKNKKYNIGIVYFNADSEGKKFNSSLVIYSQLNNIQNYDDLLQLPNSLKFRKKIIKFSIEKLQIKDLKFIGFIDFYPIKKDGLFSIMNTFKNINEFNKDVIEGRELRKKFDNVLKDFSYLN